MTSRSINLGPVLLLLTFVFYVLKLFGVISWSWIWVFAPLWIPFAVLCGILIVMGLAALIVIAFGGSTACITFKHNK